MKIILATSLLALTLSCNAESTATKKTLPISKLELAVKADAAKSKTGVNAAGKKEEDCDDKAKKPIEIKEETISLTGNTGCSLDEVKP
jgi:hypothetical protein